LGHVVGVVAAVLARLEPQPGAVTMRILRPVVGVNSRNCCFLPFFRELMLNFGESLSTGIRDPDANDFERLAASLGCLSLRRCEAPADKVGEHSACESVGAQQRFG